MQISVNPMLKITNIKIKNQSGQKFVLTLFYFFLQCMHFLICPKTNRKNNKQFKNK